LDLKTFPQVPSKKSGSGSGSGSGSRSSEGFQGSGGSGSYQPITAAGKNVGNALQKSRSIDGPDAIPQPSGAVLESVDWINCASEYARAILGVPGPLTNKDYATCTNGTTDYPFTKSISNTNYLFTPINTPATNTLASLTTPVTASPAVLKGLLPFISIVSTTTVTAGSVYEFRITNKDTLSFGETYIRAEFFKGSDGNPHLKVLRPATPSESLNAFLKTNQSIGTLSAKFLDFWNNQIFTKVNKNTGNRVGTISGYYFNTANDSVVFQTTSADFGQLGKYDIIKYYPTAYYEVYFRNSISGSLMIYKTNPAPSGTIQTSIGSWGTFTPYSSGSQESSYIVQDPAYMIQTLHLMRYMRFTVLASNSDIRPSFSSAGSGSAGSGSAGSGSAGSGSAGSFAIGPANSFD